MPIYEYECINNKHRFEVIQKFTDPPVSHCTVCGEPVQKLLSSPSFQFKGSGWYITDYARKGQSNSEKSESKPEEKKTETASNTSKTSTSSNTSTKDSGSGSSEKS